MALERYGPLRVLLAKLVTTPKDTEARGVLPRSSFSLGCMLTLTAALGLAAGVCVQTPLAEDDHTYLTLQLSLLTFAAVTTGVWLWWINRKLLEPLQRLYQWALAMCDGDLTARVTVHNGGEFARLFGHVNRLSDALDRLGNEMDDLVWSQTQRLQQKNGALELLCDISLAINEAQSLSAMLTGCATRVADVFDAGHVMTYVFRDQVAHRVDDDERLSTPVSVAKSMDQLARNHLQEGGTQTAVTQTTAGRFVLVPLHYGEEVAGVMILAFTEPANAERDDLLNLLGTLGRQLGMATVKARLDAERQQLAVVHERAALAHELHDSVAQTLAGLRLQLHALHDTLGSDDPTQALGKAVQIEENLDDAHHELRDLIAHFRTPSDRAGLVHGLQLLIERHRRLSSINIHLHADWNQITLPPAVEMQVLGVAREALANVRKHSQAGAVRVLLKEALDGWAKLLVEDDGVGIQSPVLATGGPGESVGLAIMSERSRRISGEFKFEAEPGDGARVELTFPLSNPEAFPEDSLP